MTAASERIDDAQTAPCKPVLQVFGQEKPATVLYGDGDHHAVPYPQTVILGQLHSCEHGRRRRRRQRKSISPRQDRGLRAPCRPPRLSQKDVVQLAERLRGDQGGLPDMKRLYQVRRRQVLLWRVYAF